MSAFTLSKAQSYIYLVIVVLSLLVWTLRVLLHLRQLLVQIDAVTISVHFHTHLGTFFGIFILCTLMHACVWMQIHMRAHTHTRTHMHSESFVLCCQSK